MGYKLRAQSEWFGSNLKVSTGHLNLSFTRLSNNANIWNMHSSVFVSEQVRIREDGCFGGWGRGRSF